MKMRIISIILSRQIPICQRTCNYGGFVVAENKRIEYIPAKPPKREKRVGIYCRLSTNSAEQLKSLTAQVSALTRLTVVNLKWLLVDVYIDITSSKTGSSRKEFSRILKDWQSEGRKQLEQMGMNVDLDATATAIPTYDYSVKSI